MKTIFTLSAMLAAAAMGGIVGCSGSGCGGPTDTSSSNTSGPVSMTCGSGTHLEGSQCVPNAAPAAAPAAAPHL